MRTVRALIIRLAGLLRRKRIEADMDAEIASHLDMGIDEGIACGLSREQARRAALIQLGGREQLRESIRERQRIPAFETLSQNARYALRAFRSNPAFAAIAVVTLALGIGANTAVFSIVEAVLLRPLPYGDAGRLFLAGESDSPSGGVPGSVMAGEYTDWRQRLKTFDGIGAMRFWVCNVEGKDATEKVFGAAITDNLFSVLKARPAAGRLFLPDEATPGHGRVVILSDRLWKRMFASDSSILGKSVRIDGVARIVVGVMPPDFELPLPALKTRIPAEMWAPIAEDSSYWARRDSHNLTVIGRLRDGTASAGAQAELNSLMRRIEIEHPGTIGRNKARIEPMRAFVTGNADGPLSVLMGAVGLVLLLACTNLANLFLARTTARRREIDIRVALGASRGRIAVQLLTESLMLSLAAAAIGILLAAFGVRALSNLGPADVAGLRTASVDPAVLLFTVILSVFSGVAFGLAPALAAFPKGAGRTSTQDRGTRRMHALLLVSELTVATVLTLSAGLLFRDFMRLSRADLGFSPENLPIVNVSLPYATYGNTAKQSAFFRTAIEEAGRVPGVLSVGAINYLPLSGDFDATTFGIQGRPRPRDGEWPVGQNSAITPGYFRSLGIPLLRGRNFTEGDNASAPPVIIVNQSLAQKYFPNENPLGHSIKLGGLNPKKPWREIVGVVGNERFASVDSAMSPEYYLPYNQEPYGNVADMSLIVKTASDPMTVGASVRSVLQKLEPGAAVAYFQTMDQVVSKSIAQRRFNTTLLLLFAGLALSIAIVGIYGIASYSVGQRTREIGIRIALGSEPLAMAGMVVRGNLKMGLAAIALGLLCTAGLHQVLTGLLYAVEPQDPAVAITVTMLLLAVTCAASYLPARRAAQIDPVIALRSE
jgi:predicted permease